MTEGLIQCVRIEPCDVGDVPAGTQQVVSNLTGGEESYARNEQIWGRRVQI